MRLFPVIIIVVLCSNAIHAQHTFLFKGQVYHSKLGPQKNMAVLVDNQYPAVTNDAGVFQVGLPEGTNHIRVSLSKPKYTILYPTGGYVLVPKDGSEAPQIIIGNVQDNEQLNEYLLLQKLLKNKPPNSGAELQALSKKIDSLQSILIQMHYTETELKSAQEMQEKREDYLPEINSSLTDFTTMAVDLKTAFRYVSDYAFERADALEQLRSSVNNYNAAFNKLNNQHQNYENRIDKYWQDDSLRLTFNKLVSLALDTIHRQKIYPMQETINQIRSYFNAGNKNEEVKKSIQQNIKKFVQELELFLPSLEEDTRNMARELSK